jgi:hypothetical protein
MPTPSYGAGPVKIVDTVVPEVFRSYMEVNTMQINAFFDTGVLNPDAQLARNLAGGGRTFNVPFWNDLDDTESAPASDDPALDGVPGKVTSGKDVAARQVRTRGWSTADLTRELAGSDPAKHIGDRVSAYWSRQFDDIVIATLRGVFASNITNNAGDMVKDVGTDAVGAPAAAELISAENIMDAAQTMGDAKTALKVIVMHSVVNTRLSKLDLIDFRPDSTGSIMVPHYLDYRVVVSDKVPAIAGTNRIKYHNYLLGSNCLAWAEDALPNGVETDRDASKGNGMGIEELWTRRQFAIHPYGIKWLDASTALEFPTNAELAMTANWLRVYPERKQIRMALLITNG